MKPYSLVGVDGNAYAIMGYTSRAMLDAKFSRDDILQMRNEAMSGDYNNLICVCDSWIDKVNEKLGLEEGFEDDEL